MIEHSRGTAAVASKVCASVVVFPRTVIVLNELQLENTELPMLITFDGIVIFVKLEQPENT